MKTNIIQCPNCRATLIAEELRKHQCKTDRLQWFFDGDYFWGNDGTGWRGINWRLPRELITRHKSVNKSNPVLDTRFRHPDYWTV